MVRAVSPANGMIHQKLCQKLRVEELRPMESANRRWERCQERVKKFKLSGDDAPVRCHSERSEESGSVFLTLRTERRARFLASLGMTAPVDFFTPSRHLFSLLCYLSR